MLRLLSAKVYNAEVGRVMTALVSGRGKEKKSYMWHNVYSAKFFRKILQALKASCNSRTFLFFFFGLEAELHAPVAYG